jgi:hypothetical protein
MRVQRVLMPDGSESWTVLGPTGEPVAQVEAFLAHLQALDRSPTTLRTYATTLKLWLQVLDRLGVAVDEVTVDHVSRFVASLRSPADNVAVLEGGSGRCGPATVNRHLAALFTFYEYRARNGVVLAQSLVAWRRVNRGGYRPFLHHATAGDPSVAVAANPAFAADPDRGTDPRACAGLRAPPGPLPTCPPRRNRHADRASIGVAAQRLRLPPPGIADRTAAGQRERCPRKNR